MSQGREYMGVQYRSQGQCQGLAVADTTEIQPVWRLLKYYQNAEDPENEVERRQLKIPIEVMIQEPKESNCHGMKEIF